MSDHRTEYFDSVRAYLAAQTNTPVLVRECAIEAADMMQANEDSAWQLAHNLSQFFAGAISTCAKLDKDSNNIYLYACHIVKLWDLFRDQYQRRISN